MYRTGIIAGVCLLALAGVFLAVFAHHGDRSSDGIGTSAAARRLRDQGLPPINRLKDRTETTVGGLLDQGGSPINHLEDGTETAVVDPKGDPERTREAIMSQPKSPSWAPRAENAIKSAFASAGWAEKVNVDCRSSACEITGELTGLTPANVRQIVGEVSGPAINQQLKDSGFEPDANPVYTVVSQSPLHMTFSRVVANQVTPQDRR